MPRLIESRDLHPSEEAADAFRRDVILRHRKHVNKGMGRLADLMGTHIEVRSAGNYVWDERGEKYLDCGGYGVFTLGHCHPAVVKAVTEQLGRLPLSTRSLVNPEVAAAAEALSATAPAGLDYVYFGNSGTEATEAAIKLACLNGKTSLISTHGGYHGKTLGALSVTGRLTYRAPFASLLAPADFVRFGDADELGAALSRAGSSACVILEPVQAEGGVIIPPAGYLREVERLCRHHGAFLILDEIQTGLARLGTWWGMDHESIVPDLLLVGKALGGGVVPVSAMVASNAAFEKLNQAPILHTSTFSGSPLATAAVRATVETMKDENVVPLANALGETLFAQLGFLRGPRYSRIIRELRGRGILIGIEFESEFLAGDFMIEMLKKNVVVSYSLNAHRVVRLTPSAFLNEADVRWLIAATQESVAILDERYPNFVPEREA
ncbi:MAG TPA: aminotransferase class III-fold pyridoxal phosphate-dependent enzyme [Thermoanaerobaculia bacterium]|nr:aminotransferase class III-fold pyridoxal phosphate-dependent enzyme [Thermoanaerobaculia bacterium]